MRRSALFALPFAVVSLWLASAVARHAPKTTPTVRVDMERRSLKTVSGAPFEKRAAQVRALSVTAGGVFLSPVPMVGSHILVGTSGSHWSLPIEWSLVDLVTNTRGPKLKTVWDGSAATKTAVVSLGEGEHARPALLHLDDGTLVEVEATLPNGLKATQVRVVVDQTKPVTWVFARTDDTQTYAAEWKKTNGGALDMSENIGFWPTHVSGQNGVQAWRELPNGATGACDRVVAESGWPVRCRPSPGTEAAPFDLIEDCIRFDGQKLVDDCTQKDPDLACNGPSRTLLLSPAPPRALVVCMEPKHPRLWLWSPKKIWSLDDVPAASWRSASMQKGRRSVLALELLTDSKAVVRRWLDTERGIVWDGPPLRPVVLSDQRDERRRLVQVPGKPHELWLLDLDAGTIEQIASDIDCDAPLYEYAHTGERVALSCLPHAAEGAVYNDEKRLKSWTWTEVLDLKKRIRWRTTEVFEPKIGDSGIVAGTKRGKPAQLAVIETP